MKENEENKPRNSDFTRRIKRVEEIYLIWLSKGISRHFNGGELGKSFSKVLGEKWFVIEVSRVLEI